VARNATADPKSPGRPPFQHLARRKTQQIRRNGSIRAQVSSDVPSAQHRHARPTCRSTPPQALLWLRPGRFFHRAQARRAPGTRPLGSGRARRRFRPRSDRGQRQGDYQKPPSVATPGCAQAPSECCATLPAPGDPGPALPGAGLGCAQAVRRRVLPSATHVGADQSCRMPRRFSLAPRPARPASPRPERRPAGSCPDVPRAADSGR
jgi:hypothetical protein